MNVPLLDLREQHRRLEPELRAAFDRVLAHGQFILGPENDLLEKEVAAVCQARHAIACASGSDALLLALMGFGIGPGDEVITSPYSFFATASCIARIGARAVFADITLPCYNLDPSEVLKKISPRTRAIIPVHLYGQSAEMRPYLDEARRRNIRIIEDAAQAIGAQHEGMPVGALGDVGCLSFFPTKNLGALGDAGMLLANDDELAEKLRVLRVHGAKPKYYHHVLGVNSRLDTLQAAFLRVKLPHLSTWAEARRRNAEFYSRQLIQAGLAESPAPCRQRRDGSPGERPRFPILLPAACQSNHVYNQFVIRVRNPVARDPLREHLRAAGIGAEIYYPVPLHLQKCFSPWGYRAGDFPNSELASASTLALPIFPELVEAQLQYVAKSVTLFPWSDY
ncbi:MAG: DegT/DnrJ/EryC1/StrS family aminotransferase [Verrucomicrobia bacterium]|nr:DegT/DnrJ/EryC1/StrS family aminotransferase [Verrucomicrobiota bacterium]